MISKITVRKKFVPKIPFTKENARELQKRGVIARLANIERRSRERNEPYLRDLAKKRLLFVLAGVSGASNALKLAEAYSLLVQAERELPAKSKRTESQAPAPPVAEPVGDVAPLNNDAQ